jgi:hypothetical protein
MSAQTSKQNKLQREGKANVVISHYSGGIEAIHLYSGRPLCTLRLAPQETVTDINGDGVIDILTIETSGCTLHATSGETTGEKMFSVDLCSPSRLFLSGSWATKRLNRVNPSSVKAAPPITLPRFSFSLCFLNDYVLIA